MNRYAVALGLTLLAFSYFSGCTNLIPTQSVPFTLNQSQGTFDVTAGEPTAKSFGVTGFDNGGVTIGRGSMVINPDAITFTPAGTGKRVQNFQGGETIVVTGWIGPVADLETVCETGDEYGPYTVTLDENMQPVAVSPNSISLTQSTIDLLNGGEFSVCLEVVSTVTGQVRIESFTFNLGL